MPFLPPNQQRQSTEGKSRRPDWRSSQLSVCVCVQVAAVLVLRPGASTLDLSDLRSWSAERLPPYQLPSMLRVVDAMPRNAMGKINKKSLVTQLFGNGAGFRAHES